jgi:hypothetical protein
VLTRPMATLCPNFSLVVVPALKLWFLQHFDRGNVFAH